MKRISVFLFFLYMLTFNWFSLNFSTPNSDYEPIAYSIYSKTNVPLT